MARRAGLPFLRSKIVYYVQNFDVNENIGENSGLH